jgi:two-component system, LuxR family, sensor kinase FixL
MPLSRADPTTDVRMLAAQDRFSALLDAAVDAIVVIGPDGRMRQFNRAAEVLFGYSADEVIGQNVSLLMPEPDHSRHDGYLRRYHSTGQARIIGIGREVTARRKDGATFPIELSVGEFRSGDQHGFVGILRDITQRKRNQEELRQQREQLQLIFENAPTAILTTSPEGVILGANRACCALLGYPMEALFDKRHSDLLVPDDHVIAIDQFRLLRQGRAASVQFDVRYRRADGSLFHGLTYTAIAHDEEGRPLMLIGEIIDRTDQQEAMQEAEELRDRLAHVGRLGMLGEMVSGIAHEVNQPLTAIATYAHAARRLMTSGQSTPGELVGTLEKIAAQAERAGHVIRGLRNFVRKRETVREPLDCNTLVREVAGLVDFELRQSGFQLVLRLAEALPEVLGDGVQLQQVLLNLIRNGLDAMLEKAQGDAVTVTTRDVDGDAVEIEVSDCGAGIPASVADRLFEPFFTTKPQGIGLGLSICKSIITVHGGEMRFAKNLPGGTIVAVRLPARAGG